MFISEAPDFLCSLNIVRAPLKRIEQALPNTKSETEEIIAAMNEALMVPPAPISIALPKKRKRLTYNHKQLAEKIAKHDHNEILDPKIKNTKDDAKKMVLIPETVKNKDKKLMNEIEVGLIKQNRLRRKKAMYSKVPEKVPVLSKKAEIEIREKNLKNVVESTTVIKSKNQTQTKKKTKVSKEKTIDENFEFKIQLRNRKKNFIEESLSTEISSVKNNKLINNNESTINFVDFASNQETSLSEVPPKKIVKVNSFKPKVKHRPKKRKLDWKTKNKNQQPTSSEINDILLFKIIPKLEFPNSNAFISEQIKDVQNYGENLRDNTKIEETVQKASSQESQQYAQNEHLKIIIKEKNEVTVPINVGTTEFLAEPHWHTQTDVFYDLLSTVSLGSVMSSVNQILEKPDCKTTGSDVNDCSCTELQHAIGVTDEEINILHNFNTISLQDSQNVTNKNRLNLLDLDTNSNQDTQVNSKLNFKCRVCDQSFKGIAAFHIHSLDVHGIGNPELVNVIKSEYMLVCWVCKLVMKGGSEELDKHMVRDHKFDDALNSENGGKQLKNKMANKLGEILDKALKNLISSTQKPTSKTWSGGEITLLDKLCALRNNEKSTNVSNSIANSTLTKDLRKVIGRNGSGSSTKIQPKRSQSAHVLRQNARLAALSFEATQRLTPMLDPDDLSIIYKCPVCNIGFETTSTRNKHISLAHTSLKKSNHIVTPVQSCSAQQAASEEMPKTPAKVYPMVSLGTINSKALKKFNSTCSEEVRACAKQALYDLEIKSQLKHYKMSDDYPSPNCVIYTHNVNNM